MRPTVVVDAVPIPSEGFPHLITKNVESRTPSGSHAPYCRDMVWPMGSIDKPTYDLLTSERFYRCSMSDCSIAASFKSTEGRTSLDPGSDKNLVDSY